jgi:hypothetical protein
MQMRAIGTVGVAGLMLAGVLGGCSSPPMGNSGGRTPMGDSTRAEAGSRLVTTQELSEFRDQSAERFSQDIMELDEFQQFKSTIVFGDIVNKTGLVPTADFEAFRTGLRDRLINSKVMRNKVRWIESKARWEDLKKKELGNSGDLLQEGAAAGADRKLNPEYTYFLNAEMYRVARGGDDVQMYSLTFNLMRASDSEIVINKTFESKRIVR